MSGKGHGKLKLSGNGNECKPLGGGGRGAGGFGGLDPVLPVNDPKVIDSMCETYGIDREKLPLHKNMVTRTADNTRPKRVYMLTDKLREYFAAVGSGHVRHPTHVHPRLLS